MKLFTVKFNLFNLFHVCKRDSCIVIEQFTRALGKLYRLISYQLKFAMANPTLKVNL